ncbi:component of SufBCD complex [uncultured Litoreibacter sp.]|uniref:component of SufBCD complex n=1 Tax=uncultured Litoreibacter sp. TaxID=1392394 RepID=UPI002624A7BE|nr:component of SufBCD complex [uncultured Litoreibacter sp.]
MDFYVTAFELIDLRSFSNLWFWIMLAVFWSTASHYVLGVPFDMVGRAAKHGGQAEQDLQDLVRINANRLTYISDEAGTWLTIFASFLVTGLVLTGFVYDVEFCQALSLIIVPMLLVFGISIHNARRTFGQTGDDLRRILRRHRIVVQLIGMMSILVSSMWGMYVNITTGVL